MFWMLEPRPLRTTLHLEPHSGAPHGERLSEYSLILKPLAPLPGADASSPRSTVSHNPALGRWHVPKGCQMCQYRCWQKGLGLPWHSHGFLAGGEICKLRYGLFSASSRRLYFWRPPRTRSRRTPVGRKGRKAQELFDITRAVSADWDSSPAESFRATPRWPLTAADGQVVGQSLNNFLQ